LRGLSRTNRTARDTRTSIQRAGVEIKSSERLMFAATRFEPAIPHILDIARHH
jgi:hypothetical protein